MREHVMNVSSLNAVGKYLMTKFKNEFNVFVCRIRFDGDLPAGAVLVAAPNECLVAYSSRCTHLGCALVDETPDEQAPGELPLYADGFVMCGCKCHLSTFDLYNGVPINAPATACLPQIELTGDENEVQLREWMGNKIPASVPYGVPYGRVLEDINN